MKKQPPKSPAKTRTQRARQHAKAEKAAKKEQVLPPLDSIPVDKSDRIAGTRVSDDE